MSHPLSQFPKRAARGYRARSDGVAATHGERDVGTTVDLLKQRLDVLRPVASITVHEHEDVGVRCCRHAAHARLSVTSDGLAHHPRPCGHRDLASAIGAAVVDDENVAVND